MLLGIDLIEVKRIGRLIRNKSFLERVFTPVEIEYCFLKKKSAQHFAVRFAAKEAVWKALGKKNVTLKDISVRNLPDGAPRVTVKGKSVPGLSVSLTHTDDYAAAVAAIEKKCHK